MKTSLFFTILFLLLIPVLQIEAKTLSDLNQTIISEDINKDCGQPTGYDPIRGCYTYNQIYIRSDLPLEIFRFVFLHEVGHFFMDEIAQEQYEEVFHPTPQKLGSQDIREIAADTFALWVLGGKVTSVQQVFFTKLLIDN